MPEKQIMWEADVPLINTEKRGLFDSPWRSDETLRRLADASGQAPRKAHRMTIAAVGLFDGEVFSLYDLGDGRLHVGGRHGLDVSGLQVALAHELARARS